jgi:hypothetical protein
VAEITVLEERETKATAGYGTGMRTQDLPRENASRLSSPMAYSELNVALARAIESELPRGVEVLLLPNERAALRDHIVSAVVDVLVASGVVHHA